MLLVTVWLADTLHMVRGMHVQLLMVWCESVGWLRLDDMLRR